MRALAGCTFDAAVMRAATSRIPRPALRRSAPGRPIVQRQPPAVPTIVNLEQLLTLGRFRPAAVQRDFEWDEPETRQLLADLDKIFAPLHQPQQEVADRAEAEASAPEVPEGSPDPADVVAPADGGGGFPIDDRAQGPASRRPPLPPLPNYFLGGIVLRPGAYDRSDTFDIYDGLQRVTTLTILIAILRDLTRDAGLAKRLHKLIAASDTGFRLQTAGKDTTLAENAQQPGGSLRKEDARATRDIGRRILRVKRALLEPMRLWSPDRVDRFAEFVLEFGVVLGAARARCAHGAADLRVHQPARQEAQSGLAPQGPDRRSRQDRGGARERPRRMGGGPRVQRAEPRRDAARVRRDRARGDPGGHLADGPRRLPLGDSARRRGRAVDGSVPRLRLRLEGLQARAVGRGRQPRSSRTSGGSISSAGRNGIRWRCAGGTRCISPSRTASSRDR